MVSKAREFLGVPYHHTGRSRKAVDCAGLIIAVYDELGKPLPPIPLYGRDNPPQYLLKYVSQCFELVGGIDAAKPGDILVLRFSKVPQHLAIYTGPTIIHSYENVKKVVEHRLADVWKTRITAVYRHKDHE